MQTGNGGQTATSGQQPPNSGLPMMSLGALARAIGADLVTADSAPGGELGVTPAPGDLDLRDIAVVGIGHDSRTVAAGELWVALPGERTHGARFTGQAVARGPVAILTDAAGVELARTELARTELARTEDARLLPLLVSPNPRRAMADAAALLMGEPARQMLTFGVTGTNGKTTTAFMIDSCLRATGRHVGLIGTVGFLLDGEPLVGVRTTTVTTPESPDLQRILATLVARGADAMTMEVSSHALALQRADAIEFDVAGFNNLGIDHLDFHHTLDEYFEAKAQLFTPAHTRHAVVNVDDERGRGLAERIRTAQEIALTTVSPSGASADVRVLSSRPESGSGTRIAVDVLGIRHEAVVGLPGAHNVANATLAIGMLAAAGLDLSGCLPGLATVR
ncbi:MAG: Mur ligase domain-containing protein, partial [Propionibacteriales bacterium]|nr:Mur ligase domain-containing protein [Propionibacteriales bacterium]